MTHFADLTAYTYSGSDIVSLADGGYRELRTTYRRLNVGWLDAPHPFPSGDVPEWVAPKLAEAIGRPLVNVMRGFHLCTHCDFDRRMLTVGRLEMGHAELRVPGGDGVMFAAPTLIWHYVTAHAYLPPQPFLDGLAAYDPSWADTVDRESDPPGPDG